MHKRLRHCALTITATIFIFFTHISSATQPIKLYAKQSKTGFYTLQVTLAGKHSGSSTFLMDTGSTGIVGRASFFQVTEQEKKASGCTTYGYSSSGNSYTGYTIKRSFNLSSPGMKGIKAGLDDLPVFAANKRCPSGIKAQCGVTQKKCITNPKVFMMGVGFKKAEKGHSVNSKNPLLNIKAMARGDLPRTFLISPVNNKKRLPLTLGINADKVPPLNASASYKLSNYKASSTLLPMVAFALEDGSSFKTHTARLLPDTGIGYGILSTTQKKSPCCVDKSLTCPSSKRGKNITLNKGTTVVLYASANSKKELTRITYNEPGRKCVRWSNNHTSAPSWLYNSGRSFFSACSFFFAPEQNEAMINCNS